MFRPFVEFYFPGISVEGQKEKNVNINEIIAIPEGAIAYRFFNKDEAGNKFNFSTYLWVGTKYSAEDFRVKYPQLCNDPDLAKAKRIVKTVTGGFYPIADDDWVVAPQH